MVSMVLAALLVLIVLMTFRAVEGLDEGYSSSTVAKAGCPLARTHGAVVGAVNQQQSRCCATWPWRTGRRVGWAEGYLTASAEQIEASRRNVWPPMHGRVDTHSDADHRLPPPQVVVIRSSPLVSPQQALSQWWPWSLPNVFVGQMWDLLGG